MRRLRESINAEHPHLAHDFSTLRKLTLARAMELAGDDVAHVDPAFEAFFAERNRVECYPDAIAALERIAARVPVAAITNGNADLRRIGLHEHFAFQLGASEHGAPKPDAEHLPRRVRTPRRRAAARAARRRRHRTRRRRRARAPACARAGSTATTCTARRRVAARARAPRPRVSHPRCAGRLAGRAPARTTSHDDCRRLDFASACDQALPLYCVERTGFDAWRSLQLPALGSWIDAQTFTAVSGSLLLLPGDNGIAGAVLGIGDRRIRSRTRTRRSRCRRGTGRSRPTSTTTRAARSNSAGAWAAIASRATRRRCARRPSSSLAAARRRNARR